jgi:predicted phage gp36 major capsid-like protein
MALAQSMKALVNDLKMQRKARHDFVAGNREIVRQMSVENRQYLAQIHAHNQELADQTKQMLQANRAARKADYDATMTSIREDIARIHQAKEAIVAGARGMIDEFREDHKAAQSYWAQVGTDDLIDEDKHPTEDINVKQSAKQQPKKLSKASDDNDKVADVQPAKKSSGISNKNNDQAAQLIEQLDNISDLDKDNTVEGDNVTLDKKNKK